MADSAGGASEGEPITRRESRRETCALSSSHRFTPPATLNELDESVVSIQSGSSGYVSVGIEVIQDMTGGVLYDLRERPDLMRQSSVDSFSGVAKCVDISRECGEHMFRVSFSDSTEGMPPHWKISHGEAGMKVARQPNTRRKAYFRKKDDDPVTVKRRSFPRRVVILLSVIIFLAVITAFIVGIESTSFAFKEAAVSFVSAIFSHSNNEFSE